MQFKVKGIISYPNLFQARAIEAGKDPKYSASVLIKKGDPQIAAVQTIIDQEKLNGWPSGFPANGKIFMKDGAVAFPEQPEVHGYMVISGTATLEHKPAVIDMNMNPIMDSSQIYAGSVCWLAFNSFVYDQTVNKGVSAGLNAVMVTEEVGELGRLDGRPSVETMFADVGAAGGTQAAGAPTPTPTPTPASPPVAPNAEPQYVMTAKANGNTRQQLLDNGQGWTDDLLLSQDMMTLPGGVKPSFA